MDSYAGLVLRVDLSRNVVQKEPLNWSWARRFVGGSGLAARYLYDEMDANTNPLGPENQLVWMTGLLTGTGLPSGSRSAFCARSPLTGIWGEANVGGFAGAALRAAGYDGVIITGQADYPVYVFIDGDRVELRDARPFWGLDTYATQEQIAASLGDKGLRVVCIGPAGENLVRYAAIITGDARAAGRTGLGAVMGSKHLKAIAVRGKADRLPMFDRDRFRRAARRSLGRLREDFWIEILKLMGTSNGTEFLNMLGATPARYWTCGDFEGVENLNGAVLLETLRVGSSGCWGCWVQCGPRVEISEGPYKLPPVAGPEYETMTSLGSQLMIDDLKPVSYSGYQCDALGLDTISTGAAIGFGMYLYEQGIVSPDDTGGLELRWGDDNLVTQLIPMIARREGFGNVLADGTVAMERLFNAHGLAVQVNGLDPGMHDPRGIAGMAVVYLTSPRGACHNKSDFYMTAAGHSFPEIGVDVVDPKEIAGIGQQVARHQDWRSFLDSSGSCLLVNSPFDDLVEMVNAATGQKETIASLSVAGERVFALKRLINLKLGLSRATEVLPELLRTPLSEGGSEGFVPDAQSMLNDYYQARDWDIHTGRPSPAKLGSLGLD